MFPLCAAPFRGRLWTVDPNRSLTLPTPPLRHPLPPPPHPGMNLDNGLPQDEPYVFWFLSLGLTVVLIGLTYVLMARYRLTGSVPIKTKD